MADESFNDSSWDDFKPDAARAIRATQEFESAVARTLDRPFDVQTHRGVSAALESLRAAAPAAQRVAQLCTGGSA